VESEFERPAQIAVQRVVSDKPLLPHHWQHLGRYALCQQLRTPQHYLESRARWDEVFPHLLEKTLQEAARTLEECHQEGKPLPERTSKYGEHLQDEFKITVNPDAYPETGQGEISVSMVLGREFWLSQQRHLLNRIGWVAALHSWSIAEPHPGMTWFTSDQPVVRLNYRRDGFDLKGGWGRHRGNILMPLSPRHLLWTQIGEDLPPRVRLDREQTREFQRFLAMQAHRMLFADGRLVFLEELRPRKVDEAQYQAEEDSWADWHLEQTRAHESSENDMEKPV
jgi:hypothetical protein